MQDNVTKNEYVLIQSELLDGEVIVLAGPPATIHGARVDNPGKLVYWASEVEHLSQLLNPVSEDLDAAGEDLVHQVHQVKKAFNAEVQAVFVGTEEEECHVAGQSREEIEGHPGEHEE